MKKLFLRLPAILLATVVFCAQGVLAAPKKQTTTTPTPAPTPVEAADYYLVSIKNNTMTVELQGIQYIYLVTNETRYHTGFEDFPKALLKPGIKIKNLPSEPGATLNDVDIFPIFKKETEKSGSTDKGSKTNSKQDKDKSCYFVSLEEGILTVEISGREQLQRVDDSTTYKMSGNPVGKDFIKKGMKLILSSNVPWAYQTYVNVIASFKQTNDPDKDQQSSDDPPDTLNWYFIALEGDLMTLENNGSNYLYLIKSDAHFRVGKEEVPKKILLPGMKILMPATDPGTLLSEISVIPVLKKAPTAPQSNADIVDTAEITEWTFVSLSDDGILLVEKDGQQQLSRTDDKTVFKLGEIPIKKEYLKSGMKITLSSDEPWVCQAVIKLLPTYKQIKPDDLGTTKTVTETKDKTTTVTTTTSLKLPK